MNNAWIGAIIAVVVLAVGGYYFFSGNEEAAPVEETVENENAAEARRLTLADLFFMGEDFRCEFSYEDENNKSSGTMYLAESGERIRVDFNVEESVGGPMEGSIIRKDNYSYLWSSAMEQGIKVAITEENKEDLFAGGQEGTIDENTEFDCVAWVENSSMFELPDDVEFMDLSAMTGQ